MLFKLSRPPHRIYWAYDELQQLTSIEIPRPEDLFGISESGAPLVSLDGEDYPGGIEKDLVLHRSYRCPEAVLMLAHAIGLGLYSPQGCIQMLADVGSWESIGYEVQDGQLNAREPVTIYRPPKNSPNPIARIYSRQELVTASVFESRGDELEWVAESIAASVKEQDVPPEHILAISLDALKAKSYLQALQSRLQRRGIASTIPGVSDDVAAFAEQGKVTLSTIYRAKGNEASIVHILGFDSLYDYVEGIENRNKAFASITRSKAWVRITGIGTNMQSAKEEIDRILSDVPYFRFVFPDMRKLRRLDVETSRRRKEVARAKGSAASLFELDTKALAAALGPEGLARLTERLAEAQRENQ